MSSEAHYFIAIPLYPSLRNHLSIWQDDLKEKLDYKNWPHKEDLHITLKFLGPVKADEIEQIQEALIGIKDLNAFEISIGSIGTFGKPDRPRVLWAGVDKTTTLSDLQEKTEAIMEKHGFQKETRTYSPHITLAKKWMGNSSGELLQDIKKQYKEQQIMVVNQIALFKIHPTRTPKYELIHEYKLQDGE